MNDNRNAVIRESQRQSEEILKSQLTIAIASDTRALTFCGITLTAASLLVGLADQAEVTVAMYAASAMMFAAGALSAWTAMPVAWYAPGQPGRDFAEDIETDRPMNAVIGEMVAFNDRHFDINEQVRDRQSRWLRVAALLAGSAAPVGMLIQMVAWTAQ
ncbi:MAG TPA: hypothetical protein PLL33_06860 [Paracoccus sp. (in: a-proteobacteria)]|nr:hypothetical protein [Paracoccus sp. (in: a-proteobacteria)]